MVLASTPVTLDPQLHSEDLTRMVLANFYESLVSLDRNLHVRPLLAVEWTNPSQTIWRFRLREGVLFHDGSPFGPEDVRRTIERARGLKGSTAAPDIRSIAEVRIVGRSIVELVTDRPRPLLLTQLANTPILPRSTPDPTITRPIGTGPYRFVSASRNLAVVSGTRFDAYWGKRPCFPSFRLEIMNDEVQRVRAIREGADIVTPVPAGLGVQQGASASLPFRLILHPTVTATFLVCRISPLSGGRASPFHDIRVRQALDRSIDRAALARGKLPAEEVPSWQLVVRGINGHAAGVSAAPPDLDSARSLLKEAGYGKGLVTALLVSQRGESIGRELARQVAVAGIKLEVQPLEWNEMYRRMKAGEAPLVMASWTTSSGDASSLLEPVLHSPRGPSGFGVENTSGYSNPVVDAAIAQASQEMDYSARSRLLQSAMRQAMQDLPLIPLYSPLWCYAVRRDLHFQPRLDLAVTAADISLAGAPDSE